MLRIILLATITVALVIAAATFGKVGPKDTQEASDTSSEATNTPTATVVDDTALSETRDEAKRLAETFENVEASEAVNNPETEALQPTEEAIDAQTETPVAEEVPENLQEEVVEEGSNEDQESDEEDEPETDVQ